MLFCVGRIVIVNGMLVVAGVNEERKKQRKNTGQFGELLRGAFCEAVLASKDRG